MLGVSGSVVAQEWPAVERAGFSPNLVGLAHERRLQDIGLTQTRIAANIDDDGSCFMEILEVAKRLGLALDAVEAGNSYVGDGFFDQPAALSFGGKFFGLLV